MPDRLEVAATTEGADTVLSLVGELDASTVPTFEEGVASHADVDGPLLLDLAGLEFVDSSGLGAIVVCNRARTDTGRTLELRRVPERVATVLEYAGLTDHLPVRAEPS